MRRKYSKVNCLPLKIIHSKCDDLILHFENSFSQIIPKPIIERERRGKKYMSTFILTRFNKTISEKFRPDAIRNKIRLLYN